MATWTAWSRKASDADLAALAKERFGAGSSSWCFIEGPTCSDFVAVEDVSVRCGDAWLVRVFGENGELAARRTSFDSESPWLVRIIAQEAPAGDEWRRHELEAGTEQAMVLYGTVDEQGRFVEGQQFRQPFRYPGLPAQHEGDRATLVVQVHPCTAGGPVVRWVALRPLGNPPAGRRR
jgi:hypothetical protein